MKLNKDIKIFLIFLASLTAVGLGSGFISDMTGFSDPSGLPYIGSLPVIGSVVMFVLYKLVLNKKI